LSETQISHNPNTTAPWTPELHFHIHGGHCRMSLDHRVYGCGNTLQEAADDLLSHLLTLAQHFHSGSGYKFTSEIPPLDMHWFEFLYELGDMAKRGEDIYARVFGTGPSSSTD
jgi:hypothetical protein